MRLLVLPAALLSLAACAPPPAAPVAAAAPAPALAPPRPLTTPAPPLPAARAVVVAATAVPPPAPVAVAAPPPPPAPPPPAAPWYGANLEPLWISLGFVEPPHPGRLTLSNFSLAAARVEIAITTVPDCSALPPPPPIAPTIVTLPLNGTRIIETPPGADVCWRYELPASADQKPPSPLWSGWRRAYVGRGLWLDATL